MSRDYLKHRGCMVWTFMGNTRMYNALRDYGDRISQIGLFSFKVRVTGEIYETGVSISSMLTYINMWPHIKWLLTISNDGTNSIFKALRDNTDGAQDTFLSEIVRIMEKYPWCDGIDIDLERGDGYSTHAASTQMFANIYSTVKDYDSTKLMNICLPGMTSVNGSVGGENWCVYADLNDYCDTAAIMSYGMAWAGSAPGAVSPRDWLEGIYDYAVTVMNPEKIFFGLPAYGWNWQIYDLPANLGKTYSSISTTITVSVPASMKPTLTAITLADKTNTLVPSAWNMFVQHQSGVRVSAITTAGAYSSTIKTIKLQVGTQSTSKDYSASALPQIDTITQSGSLACTVTVTDSRGRTASKTATVTFVAYAAPKFTKCVSERATSAGELDNDGTYFKSTTSITYSTCNSKNAITLTVKYKKTDAVLYGTATTITPGVNTCGGDLNTEFSYDVLYTVKDQYKVLANAKKCADANPGYSVFDDAGKVVYAGKAAVKTPFLVRVDISDLNIRTGAGTNYSRTGQYTGKGIFTILEVKSGQGSDAGWGRLKSGAGWISLDYTTRI